MGASSSLDLDNLNDSVINGATALLFMAGRKGDLNIRAAFPHMADRLVTACVGGAAAGEAPKPAAVVSARP